MPELADEAMGRDHGSLLVVGAGPKALALVAKAQVLAEIGFLVPKIVVIDAKQVAAHWTGEHGYTDGRQPLGTSPEKDVGFPYESSSWGDLSGRVNQEMLRFSWQAYLASSSGETTYGFSEWVDRGRPQPNHSEWGRYLQWVATLTQLSIVQGRVTEIDFDGSWRLTVRGDADETIHTGIGLVITGPGPTQLLCHGQPEYHPRVFDGRDYWLRMDTWIGLEGPMEVCVVGAGETAASVAVSLLDVLPPGSLIDIITPGGVVYSRGESYGENRFFSDPSGWRDLSIGHREEFVRRTDKAVFSAAAQARVNDSRYIDTRAGRVVAMQVEDSRVILWTEYEESFDVYAYPYVVCATGFDSRWFLDALSPAGRAAIAAAVGAAPGVEREVLADLLRHNIAEDLAVDGFAPKLHLPMHAGLMQGPGFPNLSSLGLLSDRILQPYVTPS